jgi:hypothetical protein
MSRLYLELFAYRDQDLDELRRIIRDEWHYYIDSSDGYLSLETNNITSDEASFLETYIRDNVKMFSYVHLEIDGKLVYYYVGPSSSRDEEILLIRNKLEEILDSINYVISRLNNLQ